MQPQEPTTAPGPGPDAAAVETPARGGRRRWLGRLALAGLLGALLLVGALWWLLGNLQTDAVKTRARALVLDLTGIAMDYRALSIDAQGLRLEGFTVASAEPDRALAPHILQIDEVEIAWRLRELPGPHRTVDRVLVRGLRVHVVIDEDGTSSVGRLLAGLPPPEDDDEPPTPLSHALQALQAGLPATLKELRVPGIRLTVSYRGGGVERRRVTLGDLELAGHATVGVEEPELALRLSSDPGGAALRIGPGGGALPEMEDALQGPLAPLGTWLREGVRLPIDVQMALNLDGPRALEIEGRVAVPSSFSWPPGLGFRSLLDMALRIDLSPDDGQTRIALRRLSGVDGRATLALTAVLTDREGGAVDVALRGLRGGLRLDGLGGLLPAGWGTLALEGTRASLGIEALTLEAGDRLPVVEGLRAEASCGAIRASALGRSVALHRGRLTVRADRDGEGTLSLRIDAPLGALSARDPATGAELRLADLAATVSLRGVRLATAPGAPPVLREGRVEASARLGRVSAVAGPAAATLVGASMALQGELDDEGARLTLSARQGALRAEASQPRASVLLGPAEVTLTVVDEGERPLVRGGTLAGIQLGIRGLLASLDARASGHSARLEGGELELSIGGARAPPLDDRWEIGSLELKARLRSLVADGRPPLRRSTLTLSGSGIRPDLDRPLASTARLDIAGDLGPLRGSATIDKRRDTLRWDGSVEIPSFAALPDLLGLPPRQRRMVDWGRLSFVAESTGRASALSRLAGGGLPDLKHDSRVTVGGLRARASGISVDLPAIQATLAGADRGGRHVVRYDISLKSPRVHTYRGEGRHALRGSLSIDPRAARLAFDMRAEAPAGPKLSLDLKGGWSGARRGLTYELEGRASALRTIARALPRRLREGLCVDLDRISGSVKARGIIRGRRRELLSGGAFGGRDLLRRLDTNHHLEGEVSHVFCRKGDLEVRTPRASFALDLGLKGGRVEIEGRARIPDLRFEAVGLHGRLDGLRQRFSLASRALNGGDTRLEMTADVDRLKQSAAPIYPIGKAHMALELLAEPGGRVRLRRLELRNALAGTALTLRGALDLAADRPAALPAEAGAPPEAVPGQRSLSVSGELVQDIGVLASSTRLLAGRGQIRVPFSVESGDLRVVRAKADLRFAGVDLDHEELDLHVRGLEGTVPVYQEVVLGGPRGVQLLGGGANNAYSRWRFQDQRPFLSGDYFVSMAQARYGDLRVGPLAANAMLDRNVFRLDQLEMDALGGKVTGQCIVDYRGRDTEMMFRGNVTGVRSRKGRERLDMNAAITFLPGQLALTGRAQVLRVGRQHLLDILDLWDPYREDVRANRLRLALKVGYPKRARLRFQYGFMDMLVEMGGLAAAVTIDEIKGVPLGPVFQKYLGPLIEKMDARAPPEPSEPPRDKRGDGGQP